MKIERKFKCWFNLTDKSRNELEKYGELNALRDTGNWTEIRSYAGMEKVVFLETNQITYDLGMGAINSLLKKGFHVAVWPHWAKGIYIAFYFPECRIDFSMWETREFDEYLRKKRISKDQAYDQGLMGHNIRCNICGNYGATWVPGARPGWGALALCPQHEKEYHELKKRHQKELNRFIEINFEQEV